MKLSQKLLSLGLSVALGSAAYAMEKDHSNPLSGMPLSKQIAQAKELGMSLEAYRQLMTESYESSHQKSNQPKKLNRKKRPDFLQEIDPPRTIEPSESTQVIRGDGLHDRVHIGGVLAGLWEIADRSKDKWSDQALREGREKFSELSLTELNDVVVRDFVYGESEAVSNIHKEVVNEKKSALALKQLKRYQEHNAHLKIGDDLFFMVGQEGVSKDSILQRLNSSGQNNNCLLFSIIREDKALLTKVVGDHELADQILATPENADVSPEDAPRRDFDLVREFFFEKIRQNLDRAFPTLDGDRMTIRDYLHHVIADTNQMYDIEITEGVEQLLATLAHNNLLLDIDFSVVFSLLYDVPVYVMSPSTENNLQMIQYTPDIFVMPQGKPTYVYHKGYGGCHYQKFYVVRERNK